MREIRALSFVLVFGVAICLVGGCRSEPPPPPPESKPAHEPVMQGCPCCPVPLTAAGDIDAAMALSMAESAWDSVPCCPCFMAVASASEFVDGSPTTPLDANAQDLASLEYTFPSSGMAVVTGRFEVIRGSASTKSLPLQVTISAEGGGAAPDTRSQKGNVAARSGAPKDTTVVQVRETFEVEAGTTTFALRAQSLGATRDDQLGTRVIQLTFLPDIQ